MTFKIEKGIPLEIGYKKYPFPIMEIGDSFHVPDQSSRQSAATSARTYGARHGIKFAVRKEGNGIRIWRVE